MSPSGPSLRGADLRSVDLSQSSLHGVDLRGADLRSVDLRERDLRGALLAGADLRGARLDGAQLAGVDLSDAELDEASFAGADVTGADLRRTRGVRLSADGLRAAGARLDGAEWRSATIVGADLTEVQGTGWRVDGADLSGARCVRARLDRAVFDDASIDGVDFEGARLVGTAFVGARGSPRIRDTVLDGADLRVDKLERFLGEGVRLVGARIRLGEVGPLEERLREAGWRPTRVERLALRARSAGAGLPDKAVALGRAVLPRRSRRGEGAPTPAVEGPAVGGAETGPDGEDGAGLNGEAGDGASTSELHARAAQTEAEQARRTEVEQRARRELRAQAVRRAMATRVATERGLKRAGAWAAQVAARSRTWQEAILGRPEEEPGPDIEGGLGFPVAAEVRDAALQREWIEREDRRRLEVRRLRRGGERQRRAVDPSQAAGREAEVVPAGRPEVAEGDQDAGWMSGAALGGDEAAQGVRPDMERLVARPEVAAWAPGEEEARALAGAEALPAARAAAGARALAAAEALAAARAGEEARALAAAEALAAARAAEEARAEARRVQREEAARQREAARVARLEREREAVAVRAQRRMEARIRADATRRHRSEVWAARRERLRLGSRAAGRGVVVAAGRVRAAAVPPLVAAVGLASQGVLRGARTARHLALRSWDFLGTPTGADRTVAVAIEAEFVTDAASRERRFVAERSALDAEARVRVALARRERAAAQRAAERADAAEERRARKEARRLMALAQAAAREEASIEATEAAAGVLGRGDATGGVPWARAGGSGEDASPGLAVPGPARLGRRTWRWLPRRAVPAAERSFDRVFLWALNLVLRTILGWRATLDGARSARLTLVGWSRALAGAAATAWAWGARGVEVLRGRGAADGGVLGSIGAAWTLVTGLNGPEETTPSDAEVAEFRRESAARDRAGIDARLEIETRSRVRVRRVRRDGESARIALAARAEALARGGRRSGAPAGLLGAAEVVAQLYRGIRAAPPLAVGPDADLRGRVLADRDLAGVDLRRAILEGVNLVGANLRGADLREADLRGADLTAARLDGATLDDARLEGALFYGADLSGVTLTGAAVTGTRLDGARGLDEAVRADLAVRGAIVDVVGLPSWLEPVLGPAGMSGREGWIGLRGRMVAAARALPVVWGRSLRVVVRVGRLGGALLGRRPLEVGPGANLRGATLTSQNLAGLDLQGALLSGAALVGADLRGSDLRGADLQEADLTGARLEGALLNDALLDRAIFDQAQMEGADTTGASVTDARFALALGLGLPERSDLAARGADAGVEGPARASGLLQLVGSGLVGARAAAARAPTFAGRVLGGVRRIREVRPTPEPVAVGPGVDLRHRQLDERDLSGVDLREANLAGAGLVGADLRGADLRGADLRGADLTAARLDGANLEGAILEGAILDQAAVAGARFDGAHVERALFADTLGLTRAQRRELAKRGADFGEGQEGVWVRATSWALAASLFLVIGVYLGARYISGIGPDVASLEHAAGEAAREGNPQVASQRFAELAGAAREVDQKVDFLLEAANAAMESGNVAGTLDLLAQAATLAEGSPAEPQVLLRTAEAQAQAGLSSAAVDGFRALCRRSDLSPTQQATALVGLARLLPDDAQAEVEATETTMLAQAQTDPERAALGMAVADSWSAVGRTEAARAAMVRALASVKDPAEVVPLQIRLARVLADDGDADGALAMLRTLIGLPGGKGEEARLGAAELLARRGAVEEAAEILAPLLASSAVDLRARGDLASSTLAELRGDTAGAIEALRRVLATDGVEAHVSDEARLALARILVKTDPEAAKALVGENAELRDEVRLGQARALREAGKVADARALLVEIADDALASDQAQMEAELSIAEVEAQDNDVDAALRRYDRLMSRATSLVDRQRIQLGSANAMVRAGRLQDAEARYLAMLNTSPAGDIADQCRLGLARAAELRGQTERATELYVQVGQSQGPWSLEALYALGLMRERLGDPANAVGAFRLAEARPAGDVARRNQVAIALARAMQDAGDPGAADAYARLLEAPDPAVRVAARLAVGDSLVGTDPARARTLFEEALVETPSGSERQRARAGWLRASVALGEVQAGMDRVRAWLETENDDALRGELAVQVVIALRIEGRLEDALGVADRYAADGGFELGMERAALLREMGRPRDAGDLLATLTAAGGEDEAWRAESQADAYIAAGQYDAAIVVLDALKKTPGGEAAAGFLVARVARERGEYDKALTLLSTSEDPRAPIERATVLEALERWDEAETAWRRLALASDLETRSAAVLGLARAALAREDAEGALQELDGLATVDPGYALTHAEVKGDALLAAGRVEEARALYGGLVADAEARTVGALGMGECELAADKAAAAIARFTDALAGTADPVYRARALGGLARAQLEAGDRAAAERTVTRLRAEHPEAVDVLVEVAAAMGG